MGYGTFFHLRKDIASLLNEEFGEKYNQWFLHSLYTVTDEDICKEAERCEIDEDIFNEFLTASDGGGEIDYKLCKKIADSIREKASDEKIYGYVDWRISMKDFVKALDEAYSKRKNLYWN